MGTRARRARLIAAVAAVLSLVPVTATAVAAPGDGDAAYGTRGFAAHKAPQGRDGALAIEAMPDGRIVVLGYRDHGTYVVTRLLPSGALDASFGGDGQAELELGGAGATPSLDHTALLVGADGAVTLVAAASKVHPAFALASGRLTADGAPDPAWGPGGVRTDDLPGALLDGPAAHRLPGGEPLATIRSHGAGRWYHHTVRVQPALAITTREISTDDEGSLVGPTLIDAAGRWLDVADASVFEPGVGGRTELVLTRRSPTGELDPTFGEGGRATVRLPAPEVNRSVVVVAEHGGDLVVAFPDALVRIDGTGRLRTELGDGGVVRSQLGRVTDLLGLGTDVVVVGEVSGEQPGTSCVASRRFTSALVPVAGWGDAGRSTICPRPGRNRLAGAAVTGGAVRLLTTSEQATDRDDSVTVTALDDAGRLAADHGTGGRVDLRNGVDGATRPRSMALLPDGGLAVAVDAPDGLGVARLDGAGALVAPFGQGGFATTLLAGVAGGPVVARSTGGFLVGSTDGIAALTDAGVPDPSFGAGGVVALDGGVDDLLELPSGRIVVTGTSNPQALVVLDADGSTAGPGGSVGFRPLALAPRGDGFVVAGVQDHRVHARAFTADLTPDPTFAGGGVLATGAAVAADGELMIASSPLGPTYVATASRSLPGGEVVAITAGGTVDPAFTSPELEAVNPDPGPRISALVVDGAGHLVIAGPDRVHLERILPTGAHDPTFGDAGVLELDTEDGAAEGVVGLAVDGEDRLVGVARSSDGLLAFRVDTRVPAELPTASIEDLEVVERGPGQSSVHTLVVRLDRPSTVPVVVDVAAVSGTATHPADHDLAPGQPVRIEIAPGATRGEVPFRVVPDGDVEPDETVTVRIVEAYQATVGDGTATVTIRDDDALRSLTAGNGFVRVGLGPPADEPSQPGDPPVAGYYLAAAQDGAFVTGYVTKGDVTTASIAGLRNGAPADVTVTPFTADGRLLPDRSGTATPRAGAPAGDQRLVGAPADLTVLVGDGHLTATWTPPADDGGSPVWAYLVVAQDAAGGGAFGYTFVEGRSYSLDGLVNGRRYTVSVAPISGLGFGGYATTTATPRAGGRAVTEPQAPSWVVPTRAPDGRSATVAIGAPADDGGSPIDRYGVIAVQHGAPVAFLSATPAYPQVHATGLDPEAPTTYVVVTQNRRNLGNLSIWPPG